MKNIEVAAAIIIKDNKIFSAQRPDKGEVGLMWEFPGGKLEPNEPGEDAIVREIKEELNTEIKVEKFFMTVKHQYKSFHITMHSYICSIVNGTLTRNEHVDSKWLSSSELNQVNWAPADMPIVDKLNIYFK